MYFINISFRKLGACAAEVFINVEHKGAVLVFRKACALNLNSVFGYLLIYVFYQVTKADLNFAPSKIHIVQSVWCTFCLSNGPEPKKGHVFNLTHTLTCELYLKRTSSIFTDWCIAVSQLMFCLQNDCFHFHLLGGPTYYESREIMCVLCAQVRQVNTLKAAAQDRNWWFTLFQ